MEYRDLGRTGLRVSVVGLGCAQLGTVDAEYAVRVVHRALELGVNFLDTARGYWDSEAKLGLALEGARARVVVSTKTGARTREEAWRHINESLERLRTDYLDNCHLHGLRSGDDLDARLGPGGALEALLRAREQGMVRHIGCTSHRARTLIEALGRFDFELILVPMNVVEREPLAALIPLCRERGVGVTIMKPLATGLLPARLALKWLRSQPIASAVPGATTIEEVEENSRVGHGELAISPAEQARIEALRAELEHVRCRVCNACLPCPTGVPIPTTLGTDVMYDHLRTMGREAFRVFPWARPAVEADLPERERTIAAIEACTRCGECERRCPFGLPVISMLQSLVPPMREMVGMYRQMLGA